MKLKLFLLAVIAFSTFILAEESATPDYFDVLHGNSYSKISYTSELSFYNGDFTTALPSISPTVIDLVNMPHRMYGRSFAYLEPYNEYATASFAFNSNTSFITLQTSGGGTGRGTLGIATKNMGISFTMEVNDQLEFSEEKSPYYKDEITTYRGSTWDSFQLLFSLPTKSFDFSTRFVFTRSNTTDTLYSAVHKDYNGKTETEYASHDYTLWGQFSLSNRPSANRFFWNGQASVLRFNYSTDSSYTDSENSENDYDYNVGADDNRTRIVLSYAFSYIVLKGSNARVHVGAVSTLNLVASDRMQDKENQRKDFWLDGQLTFYPGIWAEYAFNENWMVWAASSLRWRNQVMREEYVEHWKEEDEVENTYYDISSDTYYSGAKTGVRFNYKNISLEASVLTRFYSNPFRGFDKSTFLSGLSGIVTF